MRKGRFCFLKECAECGKKIGFLKGYRHPIEGKKKCICRTCWDKIDKSESEYNKFIHNALCKENRGVLCFVIINTKPKYEYMSELRYVRDKLKKGKYLSLDDINFLKSEHKIFEKIIKDIEKENIELIKKINEKELQIKEKVILEKEKKLRERRKKIQEERRLYEERLIQEEELISREEQELLLEKEELIPEEETNFKKWVSRRQNNETSEWQTVCKK